MPAEDLSFFLKSTGNKLPDGLLVKVISDIKKRAFGEPDIPRMYSIYLKNTKNGKSKVRIAIYPLSEPVGTNLIVASDSLP